MWCWLLVMCCWQGCCCFPLPSLLLPYSLSSGSGPLVVLGTSASAGQMIFFSARSSEGCIWPVWCCSGELAEMRRASGLGRWESSQSSQWESFLWLTAVASSTGRSQLQGRCPSTADIGIPLRQKVLGWITAAVSSHHQKAWNSSLRQPAPRLWIGLVRRARSLALAQNLVQS